MGHRGLRKEIVEHDFPDLPQGFVKHLKTSGKARLISKSKNFLVDLLSELQEWQRQNPQEA